MTNEYVIRKFFTTEELASVLVQVKIREAFDYDYDENLISIGYEEYFETSDGEEFSDYENAIEHEMRWLNKECLYDQTGRTPKI